MSYMIKDYSRLLMANVHPDTALVLQRVIDRERLSRIVNNIQDEQLREQILQEVADLDLAAAYRGSLGNVQDQVKSVPAPPETLQAEWISVREAAQILGKSERMIRIYVEGEKLPFKRKDRKSLLVSADAVEAMRIDKLAA